MKITKQTLEQIIKEELNAFLNEGAEDYESHPLYRKIVELDSEAEEALDEYIDSTEDDWLSDYVEQVGVKGLEAVAREWINDLEEGALGDALANFAAQDKYDSLYEEEEVAGTLADTGVADE